MYIFKTIVIKFIGIMNRTVKMVENNIQKNKIRSVRKNEKRII